MNKVSRVGGGAYTLLEVEEVVLGESIGLGNDGNEVDAGAQALHHFDVQRLEGMPRGPNKVQTRVHPQVRLLAPLRLLLLPHIRLVLVVDELYNR